MKKELSLYVHVPFCVKKCLYCDFLSFNAKPSVIEDYFEALCREMELRVVDYKEYIVKSVFFGGGTPSFVDSRLICACLEKIKQSFELYEKAEISIEVNPASAIFDKLKDYKRAGFNRVSIGVQSFNDEELKILGRAHTAAEAFETYENARKAGFTNINIDIMSALPGQSIEAYLENLKKAASLSPAHISAYSLIIEEGTPFYDMELELPTEDTDRLMYHETKRFLKEHGYHRYEISNYARGEENECYHNKVYWKRGDYLGLGIAAASMVNNIRWKNTDDIAEYINAMKRSELICAEREELDKNAAMEEFMFLGLRLVQGVSTEKFREEFGIDISEVYGEVISKYRELELLEISNDRYLRLTEKGLDVSNTVMAEFLLE